MNILEKRIKEKYPNEQLEVLEYTTMKKKASIKCLSCGTIYNLAAAENFVTKSKKCICKKCNNDGSGGRYDINSIQLKVKQLFPQENLKVLNYSSMKEPCKIQCLDCNTIYTFNRGETALNKNKQSVCKKCRPNKSDIIENKRQDFIIFIQNSSDFELLSNIDINNYHSQDLVPTVCLHCGKINFKYINDYLRGRGCVCQCTNSLKSLEQINTEIDSDYEILEYNGIEHQAKIKHKICGFIYEKNPRHYACPKCGKEKSKGEKIIKQSLIDMSIDYLQQQSVTIQGHNLRFDFYLPQLATFIEFQGIQHFEPVAYFGGEEKFKKQIQYDNLKREYCKNNNFTLIEITYKDLEENKIFDILKPLKFNDYPEME